MVSNDKFFTGQKPAAVLKHAVFSTYASVFFSMLGSTHRGPMWLIDSYAGPGKYDADETGAQVNGSPIVALELAAKQRDLPQIGAPRPGRRQRVYSAPDVLRLALIGNLLDFGMTLAEAFAVLDRHIEPLLRRMPATLPIPLSEADWLVAAFAGMTLWIPGGLDDD